MCRRRRQRRPALSRVPPPSTPTLSSPNLSLPPSLSPNPKLHLPQAAWQAVEYVKSGMVVGLGTGSTAAFAVDRIGQLLKEGGLTDIVGVPTSVRTYEQAKSERQQQQRQQQRQQRQQRQQQLEACAGRSGGGSRPAVVAGSGSSCLLCFG